MQRSKAWIEARETWRQEQMLSCIPRWSPDDATLEDTTHTNHRFGSPHTAGACIRPSGGASLDLAPMVADAESAADRRAGEYASTSMSCAHRHRTVWFISSLCTMEHQPKLLTNSVRGQTRRSGYLAATSVGPTSVR
jgi:hypothetical protein